MEFVMTEKDQIMPVFNYLEDTKEFLGRSDAFIPAHTGLPANCTLVPPPELTPGFAAVYDETTGLWALCEDHRGKTVYDIYTGKPVTVYGLGPLPENAVDVPPPEEKFITWNGVAWIKDSEAEKNAMIEAAQNYRDTQFQLATVSMAPLQDAVDLDMATEEEQAELLAWKKYRVLLNRVDVSDAPEIEWPAPPENV